MKNIAVILFGFLLLVFHTAVATLIELHTFSPNLMLPITISLGVSQNVSIVRGAFVAFVLGYLLDTFCGTPMGLQTFVLVATFLVARSARLRLFLRGPSFQVGLTFVISLIAGGTILALRAIFEKVAPFPSSDIKYTALILIKSSSTTALTAPVIFISIRKIEDWLTLRTDERVEVI